MLSIILTSLLCVALFGTLITLIIGLSTMLQSQTTLNPKGNQFMRLRILLQGIVLIILALLLFKRG